MGGFLTWNQVKLSVNERVDIMTNRYESKKIEEQLTCYSFYFYPIIYMYPGIYLLVLSFDLAVIYNDIVNCSIPHIVGSSYPFKTQLKEKKKNSVEKRFQ